MRTVSERLVSHGTAILCCLALLITTGLAWNVVPIAPTPWYLNTSATANLLPGSTIIDTFSLRNEDYYVVTGINGSNTVGFYRYKLGSAGWVGVNTTLGAIGWAYDNQRIWSTATVTVNPWTTVPYIIYVYSNNLVFQQYPLSDTAFDSSSTTAVGIAHTINLPTVVPNPHIVLHWVDNSTLVLGIHPYTVPNSGIQPAFIIGRFQINATNITQQTIHNRNLLVYSIEFECKLCSADNARLSFSDGTTRYLLRTGNTYSWSSPLSPLLQQYIHPELSHKCYNYTRNTTFLLFRAPLNKGINEAMFQKISDANFNIGAVFDFNLTFFRNGYQLLTS
ncbi:hypothetical protein BKA69DRAFT_764196 [Paraphysoderma sedebokerense]|nr:hypothetical protein BKA69DRAFT_764196 [Paraphysoderma sedebokerense]